MDSEEIKTESTLQQGRILIVDDEEIVHLTLKRILGPEGHVIDSAYGGKEAIKKVSECGMGNAESEVKIPKSEIRNPNMIY